MSLSPSTESRMELEFELRDDVVTRLLQGSAPYASSGAYVNFMTADESERVTSCAEADRNRQLCFSGSLLSAGCSGGSGCRCLVHWVCRSSDYCGPFFGFCLATEQRDLVPLLWHTFLDPPDIGRNRQGRGARESVSWRQLLDRSSS
jgi:hypothetical protein